jgi:hypothetical protein
MASWTHDGTQEPVPPPMLPDPLSGLVTGRKFDAEAVRVRVVEPSMPDIEAVREAMASVLDEDSELTMRFPEAGDAGGLPVQTPPPGAEQNTGGAAPADAAVPAPAPTAGGAGGKTVVFRGGAGSAGPAPTPPAGIPVSVLPPVVQSPSRRARFRADAGQPRLLPSLIPGQRRIRPPRPQRRGSFSPGLAAIGLLLLVIAVLVIVMLASLINTISSVFS